MNTTSLLFSLVIAAYGWIFKSQNDKIKMAVIKIEKLENAKAPKCYYPEIKEKTTGHDREIKDLKEAQDKLQPVLMDINKTLGELKEAISWIKREKHEDRSRK